MTSRKDRLREAKARMPLCELWRTLGLPGQPKVNRAVLSPLRSEKVASFIITSDGFGFVDFAGERGDAVRFIELALNIDNKSAINKLLEMTGLSDEDAKKADFSLPERIEFAPIIDSKELPALPEMHEGSEKDWYELALLRGVSVEAVYAMVKRGLLRFADHHEHKSWIILDKTRCNAQARRLDGQLWWDKMKALTIKGCTASWPVGIAEAHEGGTILLCEGGPDMLSGFQFAIDEMQNVSPVAMFGASQPIDAGALPLFRNRDVLICPHLDPIKEGKEKGAGELAMERWWEQLQPICASLDVVWLPLKHFTPEQRAKGVDLNDYVRLPWEVRSKIRLLKTL